MQLRPLALRCGCRHGCGRHRQVASLCRQVDPRSWLRNSKGVACSRVARPLGSDSRPQRIGQRCGCGKATKLGHCVRPRRLALRSGCGHGCCLGLQVGSRCRLRKFRGVACSRAARGLACDSRPQRSGWRCCCQEATKRGQSRLLRRLARRSGCRTLAAKAAALSLRCTLRGCGKLRRRSRPRARMPRLHDRVISGG